jgi:signal transduction histidine kinase
MEIVESFAKKRGLMGHDGAVSERGIVLPATASLRDWSSLSQLECLVRVASDRLACLERVRAIEDLRHRSSAATLILCLAHDLVKSLTFIRHLSSRSGGLPRVDQIASLADSAAGRLQAIVTLGASPPDGNDGGLVRLDSVVGRAVEAVNQLRSRARISVDLDGDAATAEVPGAASVALENVIDNAVAFGTDGIVTVEARRRGHRLEVDVRNLAPRYPRDALPRGSEFHERGLGVGLLLSTDLVESLGGRLEVELIGPEVRTRIAFRGCWPRLGDAGTLS